MGSFFGIVAENEHGIIGRMIYDTRKYWTF